MPQPREQSASTEWLRGICGLAYCTDQTPGIRRIAARKGFRYIDANGKAVRDPATLERIRSLVIPPNWTDVWICPRASGHLQVTARDARGRKQYRYHPRYRAHREETKFGSMSRFGKVLPRIRRRIARDLSRRGLPRERVLASVVRLLDRACIRVGNAEYARQNGSYGLTTLRNRHVKVAGQRVELRFKGKSGRLHELTLDDRRLAKVVKRCRDLPGYPLFQYVDEEGEKRSVDSGEINSYLREISGEDITAKHFRTWHGSVQAAVELKDLGQAASERELKRKLAACVKEVSERLGNQPASCRKYYIHPAVIDAYSAGVLGRKLDLDGQSRPRRGLTAAERGMLRLLRSSRHGTGRNNREYRAKL